MIRKNQSENDNNYIFERANMDTLQILINNELDKKGVREKLSEMKRKNENLTEEDLLKEIMSKEFIDEILGKINKPMSSPSINRSNLYTNNQNNYSLEMSSFQKQKRNENNIPAGKLCLLLQIEKGMEFIDFETKNKSISQIIQKDAKGPKFVLDINFFGQRQLSDPIPISSDFDIGQAFLFDLNPMNTEEDLSYTQLRKISDKIHIVITLLEEGNKKKMIASKSIEWRWCLCYGGYKTESTFNSPSTLNNINVGKISMIISITPENRSHLLSETSIKDQVEDERKIEVEKSQDYIEYSTNWWNDYKSIKQSFGSRLIKLFLPTEDRENYAYKPACSLIVPILTGRAINTPYEAARFVSLIPYERRENLGGDKIEIWHTVHTFLSVAKGDIEDHVLLLCNLLLGFGLDAYIASGVAANGPHLWCITRYKNDNNKNYSVIYWESLTGQRIRTDDPKIFRFYKRIHCVFNHSNFYANIQNDDNVFNVSYIFEDESLWKNIPSDKINEMPKYSSIPDLDIININKTKDEMNIEQMLKSRILQYRKTKEFRTSFDDKLSHLLAPSLVNYEMERVCNQTYGNEEFKASIKSYIPEGFTFKAFPFYVNDLEEDAIFNKILNDPIGVDILNTKGDQVSFGIRCKLFPYPQGIYSLWTVVGVKFRVIK